MNKQVNRIPEGYMPFPKIFLQAGSPLKLSIYMRSTRGVAAVVMYKARGNVLTMEELMQLQKLGQSVVLANRAEATEQALALFDEDPEGFS